MIKQADDPKTSADDSSGKSILEDKRLLGIAAAGLLGGTAGALVAPDFIYKKPTRYNRLLLGAGSGLTSAAIVAAAMAAMDSDNSGEASWGQLWRKVKDSVGGVPASLSGAKYTKQKVGDLPLTQRALHGIKGSGSLGWFVRNFLKRPFGNSAGMWGKSKERKAAQAAGIQIKTGDPSVSDHIGSWAKTLAGIGIPAFTGYQVTRGLNNFDRARQFVRLASLPGEVTDAQAQQHIQELMKKLDKNFFKQLWQGLKASGARPTQISLNLLSRLSKNPNSWLNRTAKNVNNFVLYSPYLQTAGVRSTPGGYSGSLLSLFQRNQTKNWIKPDGQLIKLLNTPRTAKVPFMRSFRNKGLGVLAAIAALGGLGGINSFGPLSDPDYEAMINSVNYNK